MEPESALATEPAVAAALSPLPEINEGDTFFALATFVSETGEAMNLVEGEKVQWKSTELVYVCTIVCCYYDTLDCHTIFRFLRREVHSRMHRCTVRTVSLADGHYCI